MMKRPIPTQTVFPATAFSPIVPGQKHLSASELNSVLDIVNKMRTVIPSIGAHGFHTIQDDRGNAVSSPIPVESWVGTVSKTGAATDPNDPQFVGVPPDQIPPFELAPTTGPVYFVKRARKVYPTNFGNVILPPDIQPYPETDVNFKVVAAFNVAELDLPLHALKEGTVVTVFGEWEPGDGSPPLPTPPPAQPTTFPAPVKRFWFDRTVSSAPILAVAVDCLNDETTGSTIVTAHRLLSLPYNYELSPSDPNDIFVAWGGIDPLIVPDQLVAIQRMSPMPDDTSFEYLAIPLLSAPRQLLDIQDPDCLTSFTEPCAPPLIPEMCLGP